MSLTFDDTNADQWEAVRIMDQHQMLGTFYVNSSRIDHIPEYLSKAHVDAMQAQGHEIGGHTRTHRHLQDETDVQIVRDEICGDKTALTQLGYNVTNFAYPFGETGGHLKEVATECYASARDVGSLSGTETAESIPPRDAYAIRAPSSIKKDTDLSQLKLYITRAQNDHGGWVLLVFHHISDDDSDDYTISPARFRQFLEWLSGERSAGRIKIATVKQVLGN